MRKLFLLSLALLASFSLWANQTDLISGVTLPDIPASSLDMATQTFKTPDANGWIVMDPNADIRNASVTWFTAMAWNTSSQTISDVSSFTAPFYTISSVAVTTVQKTGRTKAIRFTGATDISFLVSSGGSRTIYVSLYSYNGVTQSLVETKSCGNSWNEFLFSGLTSSTTYIAYMYESADSNGLVAQIAIKKYEAPAVKYTVTYKANNGTSAEITDDQATEVAACSFSYTGKDFTGWNTEADGKGDSYAVGDEVSSNLTLYAQWVDHVAKYTVIYKDGETTLGSETVDVGKKPTATGIATPSKDYYTFAAWSPALNTVSGTEGQEIVVNATWTANYAYGAYSFVNTATVGTAPAKTVTTSEVTYEAFRVDNFYFSGMKIQYESGASDVLTDYKGWKIKTKDATIKFLVENNSQVKVAIGRDNPAAVSYTALNGTVMNNVEQAKSTEVAYSVKAGTMFTLSMTTGSTITLKRLSIANLYNVTYTDAKGDASGSDENVTEVTLPTPSETTVGGYSFTGWIANQTVYKGETAKTAGSGLNAGETYTLTATTTFTAQWQLIADFDVKFFQGYGDPDVQIGETQSISTGNHAVAPADPTREGYIFRGWSYDATEAHIVDVATHAITEATNFTAIWSLAYTITHSAAENGTYTIKVGDAEAVDTNTAAYAGQTITLAATPSSGYQFSSWTVMNGETPVEVSNNQFTMPAANVTVSATFEVKPSVNDLVTIADDWTFTPSATIAAGTLAEDNKLFASGANDCDISGGKMRIKENRALAFKLNSGAKVKVTFTTNGDIEMKLGTAMTGDDSQVYGHSKTSPVTFTVTADGVVYLTATNQLYMSKMEIMYPHTVTYDLNGGTGTTPTQDASYVGTEITIASSEAFEKVGYNFTGWLCNIDSQVKAAGASYTMTAANTTFTAQWEAIIYNITIDDEIVLGTVEADKTTANYGETVTLNNTPAEGYILDAYDVYKTGESTTKVTVTDGKFTMPAYAVTVSATFKVDPSTALDNTDVNAKAVKRLENGILVIEKNGRLFNAQGQLVK